MAVDPIIIRPVGERDAGQLLALWVEALTLHPAAFAMTPAEAATADWARDAREHGRGDSAIFVVEAGGELVGLTGIASNDRARTRHAALIWGAYVRAAWRGRGLGERMVNAAVDWASRGGRTIVRLSVTVGNDGARRVYERCGFTPYGFERQSVVVDGVALNDILMDKVIGSH